jgi:hypothetical protein
MTSSDVLENARPMFFRKQEGEWEMVGYFAVFSQLTWGDELRRFIG